MTARWLLFDVEGTITSLAFVKDGLFSFAARALPDFLRTHASQPQVAALLDRLSRETGILPGDHTALVSLLQSWIDEDRKHPDLKELQGLTWEDGYRSGELRGHVYPDVAPFWERARANGRRLAIYSSGSVHAQKLLLRYSVAGDLARSIDQHFDTAVGAKLEASSYVRIADALECDAAEIVFFSDVEAELDSAKTAGLRTCRLLRPGVPPGHHSHLESPDLASVADYFLAKAIPSHLIRST